MMVSPILPRLHLTLMQWGRRVWEENIVPIKEEKKKEKDELKWKLKTSKLMRNDRHSVG